VNTRYRLKAADAKLYRFFVIPNFEKTLNRVVSLGKAIAAHGRDKVWGELADSFIQEDTVDAKGETISYKHAEWSIVPNKLKRDANDAGGKDDTQKLKYLIGIVSVQSAERVRTEDEKIAKQPPVEVFLEQAYEKLAEKELKEKELKEKEQKEKEQKDKEKQEHKAVPTPTSPVAAAKPAAPSANLPVAPVVQQTVLSPPAAPSTPIVSKLPPPAPEVMVVDTVPPAAAAAMDTTPVVAAPLGAVAPLSDAESVSEADDVSAGGTATRRKRSSRRSEKGEKDGIAIKEEGAVSAGTEAKRPKTVAAVPKPPAKPAPSAVKKSGLAALGSKGK
jgi:hypothetical protein